MRSNRHLFAAASGAALLLATGLAGTAQAFAPPSAAPAAAAIQPSDAPAPWAQDASDIPADAAVRYGRLSNGMRYALIRNATPPGAASIRLRIAAGSLMEEDNQLGLAHFMEHMAFNGTTNVPENEMLRILERLGLAFGADTNASTGLDQTVYMLELPNTRDETVDPSLNILREMMSAALMEPGAIDEERGVIEGELRTRDTPGLRVAKAQFALLAPGQRMANRLPGGDLNIIRTAPRERFVSFYEAYYRPSRATIVIAGDFDIEAMEAKIRQNFESWTPAAPNGPEPDLGSVAPREPETKILVEPGTSSSIQINWIKAPDLSPDTVDRRTRAIKRNIGLSILNRRLGEISRQDNAPFIGAGGGYQSLFDSLDLGVLSVSFNPGAWKPALEAAEREQRRLVQFGVTDQELQRAITDTRTSLQNAVAAAATRSTPALASGLVNAINNDSVFTSPQTNLEIFNQAVEGLTPAAVLAETAKVFDGQGPLVLFVSPVPVEGGEAAVTEALTASRATAVTARAADVELTWPYTDFGTPGVPSAPVQIADLGLTTVAFPNGVRLNIKPTDFRDDQILISVRTGIGELGLPTDRFSPMALASSVMGPGGLGKLSVDELNRVLSGRTYSVNAGMTTDGFTLSGATKPEDLQLQMQILAASLTDPGLRAAPLEQLKGFFPQILAQLAATPGGAFQRDSGVLLAGGDQREVTPTAEQVAAVTIDQIREGVRAGRASGPIDITIVGDVTVDAAVAAVASTFGALPARGPQPSPAPGSDRRRFPAPTTEPVKIFHTGPAEQAMAYVAWPTTDQIGDRTTARQLSILADVLQLRVNEEIREKLSIAYSPGAGASSSDVFEGYGSIYAAAETAPENIGAFFEAMDRIAADLRDNPISEDELNRARRPAVEQLKKSMADNGYWLLQVADAQRDPTSLDQTRNHVATLEAITAADLQALAQLYLRPDRAWRAEVIKQPGS